MVTAETICNKFLGKTEKPHSLIEIFKDHNRKVEALLGKEFTKGTLYLYQTSLKHTKDILKWKYNLSDIDIKKVDPAFIMEYEFYLRSERKCANNSSVKHIKNFGKIIRICIANRWLIYDPFLNYKIKTVDRVFLTTDELRAIADKTWLPTGWHRYVTFPVLLFYRTGLCGHKELAPIGYCYRR